MATGISAYRWIAAFIGGALVTGLGTLLALQGLDRADKLASVLGLFVGLLGLGVAVTGVLGGRRNAAGQAVTDSRTKGSVTQIRGVQGSVRLGAEATAATPDESSPTSGGAPARGGGAGEGQSVARSWTVGPVRQIDEVGGDVDIDR